MDQTIRLQGREYTLNEIRSNSDLRLLYLRIAEKNGEQYLSNPAQESFYREIRNRVLEEFAIQSDPRNQRGAESYCTPVYHASFTPEVITVVSQSYSFGIEDEEALESRMIDSGMVVFSSNGNGLESETLAMSVPMDQGVQQLVEREKPNGKYTVVLALQDESGDVKEVVAVSSEEVVDHPIEIAFREAEERVLHRQEEGVVAGAVSEQNEAESNTTGTRGEVNVVTGTVIAFHSGDESAQIVASSESTVGGRSYELAIANTTAFKSFSTATPNSGILESAETYGLPIFVLRAPVAERPTVVELPSLREIAELRFGVAESFGDLRVPTAEIPESESGIFRRYLVLADERMDENNRVADPGRNSKEEIFGEVIRHSGNVVVASASVFANGFGGEFASLFKDESDTSVAPREIGAPVMFASAVSLMVMGKAGLFETRHERVEVSSNAHHSKEERRGDQKGRGDREDRGQQEWEEGEEVLA